MRHDDTSCDHATSCETMRDHDDERYKDVWQEYYQIMQRKGVSIDEAKFQLQSKLGT